MFKPKVPCSTTRRAALSPRILEPSLLGKLPAGQSLVELKPKWVEDRPPYHLSNEEVDIKPEETNAIVQSQDKWAEVSIQSYGFPVEIENGMVVENTILAEHMHHVEPDLGSFLYSVAGSPIGYYIGSTDSQYVFVQISPENEEHLENFRPDNVAQRVHDEVRSLLSGVQKLSYSKISDETEYSSEEASQTMARFRTALESGDQDKLSEVLRVSRGK